MSGEALSAEERDALSKALLEHLVVHGAVTEGPLHDEVGRLLKAARAEERERIAVAIEGERCVAFSVGDGSGWSHAITRAARIARITS